MEETAKQSTPDVMTETDVLKWQLHTQNVAFAETRLELAKTVLELWQARAGQALGPIAEKYQMKDGDKPDPQTRTITRAHGKLEAVK